MDGDGAADVPGIAGLIGRLLGRRIRHELSWPAVTVCSMTAATEPAPDRHGSGLSEAAPVVVRAALVPEDAERFDEQWRAAMAAATASLDLGDVHRLLEHRRRIARLTVGLGHDGYRRMLAEAEHTARTGEMPARPVPIEQVRLNLAARIAAGPGQ